jgi:3-methylcrotonyl-CoA carboxylase alpha subunit
MSVLRAAPTGVDPAAIANGVARLVAGDAERARGQLATDDVAPSPWDATDGFQLSGRRVVAMPITANGQATVALVSYDAAGISVAVNDQYPASDAQIFDGPNEVYVLRGGRQTIVRRPEFIETALADRDADGAIRAPMHGKVLAVLVEPGQDVRKGQRIAVIEAMKMEHALTAPFDGAVRDIAAEVGSQVAEGAVVLRIEAAKEAN